ncbi:hypothetical protein CCP2SC5_1130006 [Azospirillaceae bacterium]
MSGQVVERLIQLIASVSPGAKLSQRPPTQEAELALIEAGDGQPRSLANAFMTPVRLSATAIARPNDRGSGDYCGSSTRCMAQAASCGAWRR